MLELNIYHFIKIYTLTIPLFVSVILQDKWEKENIIRQSNISYAKNENEVIINRFFIQAYLFIFNGIATVIAYKVFYHYKIPIISKTFLITFLLLSLLYGIYLGYIRIKLKY